MSNVPTWMIGLVLLAVLVLVISDGSHMNMMSGGSTAWKIQNAMSAAPEEISRDAAIFDWSSVPGAPPVQLRAGSNGWQCFADDPATPTNDPMCIDQVFQAMIQAWSTKSPFAAKVEGFGYMLQGASDASSSDPFKTEPGPGGQWIISPPHVMLISPDPDSLANLPAEPTGGGPWVMWKGTPYQHVMMPISQ
ncbi:hypothetical protein HYR53_10855 [Candidatus Acetothermia bacterium]|nr:hypothetical protein [Candidatus Acetothermia bacterium]